MSMTFYPKRLIEVDLRIARISTHARREKSIRHGHISTLHIWWARRPLAACRAVICAALWPDPVDLTAWLQNGEEVPAGDIVVRPVRFLDTAQECMIDWGKRHLSKVSAESYSTFIKVQQGTTSFQDPNELRRALLDFIADFSNSDNSTDPAYLETARKLTQAAHEALGGEEGTRPLVVDPFAGGGSIPLEALRVGADAFASELNPVAVLLNKIVLEYIPKYGPRLADEVRKWGEWIKQEAEKELAEFYPKGPDGTTPIAYLWARTIQCEGPDCGAEVPLIRSLWLAKTGAESIALELIPNKKSRTIAVQIRECAQSSKIGEGTVKRSSATCPCCGYTTPAKRVREQFKKRQGGAGDARLLAIRFDNPKTGKRGYRLPLEHDILAAKNAAKKLAQNIEQHKSSISLLPDEELPYLRSIFNIKLLGVDTWGMLFSPRQALALIGFAEKITKLDAALPRSLTASERITIKTCLAIVLDRLADFNSSLCVLNSVGGRGVVHTFGRQALGIVWDFMETNPFNEVGANWNAGLEAFEMYIADSCIDRVGIAERCSAVQHPLPNDSAALFATDPPYYDAVPYADLSDFFFVWLKRTIGTDYPELLSGYLTQKDGEIVQLAERNPKYSFKTREYFEALMCKAMIEGRRVLHPIGVGIVVFAHKTTAGWEAQLQAMVDAGWIIVASWPIDTERPGRLRALNSAVLASSIHLVCRPRENPDGSMRINEIGDWRDVLAELPHRIHEWMPRLAEEGVVGADAIFACLGPALEIFSRYSRVEKSSGEAVPLREYLEQVWAAVSKEALSMIFKDADTSGLEPDARLTAMWLWTLGGGARAAAAEAAEEATDDEADDEESTKAAKTAGFVLEFDAARKIAQGLGVHLEKASSVVEVKGDTARLLSVAERTKYLFGKEAENEGGKARRKKKEPAQRSLFVELEAAEKSAGTGSGKVPTPTPGSTVLDQVHQAMILFAAGRGEAMKRFLVEDGVGKNAAFWKLAQSLSALYPPGGDEKRWVDGVLARKKGLGL
jgi:putative DNA methylase